MPGSLVQQEKRGLMARRQRPTTSEPAHRRESAGIRHRALQGARSDLERIILTPSNARVASIQLLLDDYVKEFPPKGDCVGLILYSSHSFAATTYSECDRCSWHQKCLVGEGFQPGLEDPRIVGNRRTQNDKTWDAGSCARIRKRHTVNVWGSSCVS